MFTGIIEGPGIITAIRPAGQGRRLAVTAGFALDGTKIGDSIAVNGACLTVVALSGTRFDADVSPETMERTAMKFARTGDRVNLERALTFSGRLDGHLVSGHIDGTATMAYKTPMANAILIGFDVDPGLARYMIPKGSVAVDGISLTINTCDDAGFEVGIIPHTAEMTTIGIKKPGARVNIETDMIGKYVEKFLSARGGKNDGENKKNPLNMDFLLKTGFI
jgi:riboflavin synthase